MIEAKGRNGYFRVGHVEIWKTAPGEHETMYVDLYSTRPGENPPARIQGTPEEILSLMSSIYIETVAVRMGKEAQTIKIQEKGEKEDGKRTL